MVHDYGFDLPDARHSFIAVDGQQVTVNIERHWKQLPDDDSEEPSFDVSWCISHAGQREDVHLPIGTRQEQAEKIAHIMWEEDIQATKAHLEMLAEEAAERRMGA